MSIAGINETIVAACEAGMTRAASSIRLTKAGRLMGRPILMALVIAAPMAVWGQDSVLRHRPMERVRDPLVGRADIGGRVFEDRSDEGLGSADSPGISGVMVSLDDGRYAVTGPNGWWQLSEVAPGQRVVTIRTETLPAGASLVSRRIVEAPPGSFVRVDFAVPIELETHTVGQKEILGHRAFPKVEEIPVNVVGNATDIQALVNGARVVFPRADIEILGLAPGGSIVPNALRRLRFRLEEEADLNPSEWKLTVVTADGTEKRTIRGDGQPPARMNFDGRDDTGELLTGPTSYSVRLCVEYGPRVSACSPYRPFGVVGIEGRSQVQPMLELPRVETRALVNEEPATLDEDGSFILPVRPDEDRILLLDMSREDGRHARAEILLPTLQFADPTEDFSIEWGESNERYEAPEEPGTIKLRVRGTTEPVGSRLQLGRVPVEMEDGAWQIEIDVPLGQSRFELTLTDPRGFNILKELHFLLADRSPEGDPLIIQPRIPDLEVRLPPEDAASPGSEVRVRGTAAADARVLVNDVQVDVDETGGFDLLARLEPETGRLEIVAIDEMGRRGTIEGSWQAKKPRIATGTWLDAEPFVRLLHGDLAEDESAMRTGLAGTARLFAQRAAPQGMSLFGGVSAGPSDRFSGSLGPLAKASVYGGLEANLGSRFLAGLRYEGAAFFGGDSGYSMRHDAGLTAMLRGEAFDLLLDSGIDTGIPDVDDAGPLAGAGLGFRLRATETLNLRVRAGALIALSETEGGLPEILDASAQLVYSPKGDGSPTLALRYSHIEDHRLVHPEASGDVLHLALAWPLNEKLRLVQSLGAWLAGAGSFTAMNVSRVELLPTSAALFAVDYRLLTQLDRHEHTVALEGSYDLLDWLRLGGFYQFSTTGDTGETASRLQTRLQAHF